MAFLPQKKPTRFSAILITVSVTIFTEIIIFNKLLYSVDSVSIFGQNFLAKWRLLGIGFFIWERILGIGSGLRVVLEKCIWAQEWYRGWIIKPHLITRRVDNLDMVILQLMKTLCFLPILRLILSPLLFVTNQGKKSHFNSSVTLEIFWAIMRIF